MNALATPPRLEELRRRQPDWDPWLALVEATLESLADEAWTRLAPAERAARDDVPDATAPLLAGATVPVDVDLLRRHVNRLAARGAGAGRDALRRLTPPEAAALLEAAADQDVRAIDAIASRLDADPPALRAVAPLVAMPVLHACRRAWTARISPGWTRPYCPLCGAWPALAEVRGLDRSRRFRCIPCGSDWHAGWLVCPYCGNGDHTQQGALVAEDSPETRRAETCVRCRGYIKSVAVLQACPPPELPLLDLETVALDVAAVAHGYRRPEGVGHRVGLRVEPKRGGVRGLLAWRPTR